MDLNNDLSEFFITKNQAADFIQSLNNIIDKLYEVNFNLEDALINEFGIDKKDEFISLLREKKINTSSNDELKKYLTQLQEYVRSLPVLTLTIAFEPNSSVLKEFLRWFMFTLKKQILLDIDVNKKLIAGATINYNGKFRDYSIAPVFNQILNQNTSQNNKPKQPKQANKNLKNN